MYSVQMEDGMRAQKVVSLVKARASLSQLTREVAHGHAVGGITQRSKRAAVLVNAEQFERDMTELEYHRRQHRKGRSVGLTGSMEVAADLTAGSGRLAEEYSAAVRRSGAVLRDALRHGHAPARLLL
jgi:prevent-host-death family protein